MPDAGSHIDLVQKLQAEALSPALLDGSCTPEEAVLEQMLALYQPREAYLALSQQYGSRLLKGMHEASSSFSLEAWLQEYGLGNQEGLILMQVAEALLRIPDQASAEQFITDKLKQASWQNHLGHSS